jgi:hypothetical protein
MARRSAAAAILTLAVGAASLPALATGEARSKASRWVTQVKVLRCSRALHEAVFHARMRRVADSDVMALRLNLLERTGVEGFQPLAAPGLGKWRRSKTGVGAFGYKQIVRNLDNGGVYRVRVDYRWYTADGEIVSRARRRSNTCPRQNDLPNLRVHFLGVRHTSSPATDRYRVRVTNAGHARAEDAVVQLSVDGLVGATATTGTLYAGAARILAMRAPECQSWAQVQVDPNGLIAETVEQDNTHQLACADLD